MNISTVIDGVTVYRLTADNLAKQEIIDEIRQDLLAIVNTPGPVQVAVDFSQVRFASSLALGLLVGIRKRLEEQGGAMAVFGIKPTMEHVMKVMHLDELFGLFADEETAIASLKRV